MTLRNALLAAGLSALSLPASAATFYDNGAPNVANGYNFGNPSVADDFTLSTAQYLEEVTFWAYSNDAAGNLGQIGWGVYLDAASLPGAEVATGLATSSSVTATGDFVSGYSIYEVTFSIGSLLLDAGQQYWLALDSGSLFTNTTPGFAGWVFNSDVDGDTAVYGQAGSWSRGAAYPYDSAFTLSGSPASPVPLPASGVLLLSLLGGVVAWRRKSGRS